MSTSLKEEKARMLKLMGFSYKDNSHDLLSEQNIHKSLLDEQKDIDISLPDNINAIGGRVGQTKKEFKQQQKAEEEAKAKKIAEGTEEEIKKLFIEKFVADIGKRKAFKALPQSLKEELMGAWFTEGGLPKDFWVNPDGYRFVLYEPPKEVGPGFYMGISGEEGKTIGKEINTRYQAYDKENFANYNGKSNTYKYIKPKPNYKVKPLIEDGNIVEGTITMTGFQILVLAPKISDDGELSGAKTTETENQPVNINLNISNLPVGFDVQRSTLPGADATILLNNLRSAINNNQQIQQALQTPGAVMTIDNVRITSSASNQWNGPTPFTHNNDRSPADTSNGNNPDSSTYTGDVRRNFNLAGQRGITLQTLLSTDQRFMQALGITDQTNFGNIDARITDTGGQNDPPNAAANTRGQYASFDFVVTINYPVPPTIATSIKIDNFKISLIPKSGSSGFANAFDIHFTKAKYLKRGGERKSSAAIGRNLGKSFRGFGSFLDSILP